MIKVRQIKILVRDDCEDNVRSACAKKLGIKKDDIIDFSICKKSLDARKKPELYFVYEVLVKVLDEDKILKRSKDNDVVSFFDNKYKLVITGKKRLNNRPVIVGTGPAGLFCGYMLAKAGYKPLIIERGEMVFDRVKTVLDFWENNKFNPESNVQFGEGGAGTFSDGKLLTRVKDKDGMEREVFDIFVKNGAPEDILYSYKPHIGTDLLRNVIVNIREEIKKMGGEFLYNSKFEDINIVDGKVSSIKVNNEWIDTEVVVLAIGHSARDTVMMLKDRGLDMESKPFAVGVRIQHPQDMIDLNQYGSLDYEELGAASYKLTYKSKNNRGVYSFCMCPGGYVVNASSEEEMTAVNGMSNHGRESGNANSAIVVTVNPDDFDNDLFGGMKFQRKLEKKAYEIGKGKIPVQLFGDYKKGIISSDFGSIKPVFKGEYVFGDLNEIFPDYINEALKEAIDGFDKNIPGFSCDDAILAGVESRTSSPIRIIRDDELESNIKGIYPCGEGGGYAGGITSSAIDGIKVATKIFEVYSYIK